jgi:D-alanyl-lipoteichoic acid acyltransferase DltB (MBOAT superfamily)
MLGNIFLTMLLGGIWHGANWTFAFWGALHGLYLVTNHLWRATGRSMPEAAGRILTLLAVLLAWIPFRAESLPAAWRYFLSLFGAQGSRGFPGGEWQLILVAVLSAALLFMPSMESRVLRTRHAVLAAIAFFVSLLLLRETSLNLRQSEFIYFRF